MCWCQRVCLTCMQEPEEGRGGVSSLVPSCMQTLGTEPGSPARTRALTEPALLARGRYLKATVSCWVKLQMFSCEPVTCFSVKGDCMWCGQVPLTITEQWDGSVVKSSCSLEEDSVQSQYLHSASQPRVPLAPEDSVSYLTMAGIRFIYSTHSYTQQTLLHNKK